MTAWRSSAFTFVPWPHRAAISSGEYLRVRAREYVHVHVHVWVRAWVRVCVGVRACVHVCVCVSMRACVRVRARVRACACVGVRACVRACVRWSGQGVCAFVCLFVCPCPVRVSASSCALFCKQNETSGSAVRNHRIHRTRHRHRTKRHGLSQLSARVLRRLKLAAINRRL